MIDVEALGEPLIDFATVSTDIDGYPTMAAHPGDIFSIPNEKTVFESSR